MPHAARSAGLVLLALLLGAAVGAQEYERGNAAGYYQRAFDRAAQLSMDEKSVIDAYQIDPGQAPPEGLRTLLARQAATLADFRRGSQQPYLDWHLDYGQGFSLVLPHLGQARYVGRIVRAQVILDLHDGRTADAAEGVATLYRAAAQFGADRILISSLVARSLYASAEQLTAMGLDRAAFEGVAVDRLRAGHATLEVRDPFAFAESIAIEHELAMATLEKEMGTAEQRADMLEQEQWIINDEEQGRQLAGMDDAEFADHTAAYDAAMDEVAEIFRMEDEAAARARLEQFGKELEAGLHGELARMLMPSFDRAFDVMVEAEKAIAARAELLRGLATGAVDTGAQVNAAVLYLKAAELVAALGPEVQAALLEEDATGTPSDVVSEIEREKLDEILAYVREASTKQRCDFTYLRDRRFSLRLCPEYVADLCDLVRLLRAEQRRQVAAGDAEAVADRLELAYRFVAHGSNADEFTVSVLVHETLLRTSEACAGAIDRGLLDAMAQERLFRVVDRIPRADPFGYIATKERLRDTVRGWILRYVRDRSAMAPIEQWDSDECALVLAVYNAIALADGLGPFERRAVEHAPVDRLQRVPGLLDPEQLAAATVLAPTIHARLAPPDPTVPGAAPDPSVLQGIVLPLPARLELRSQAARSDLRHAVAQLRPASAAPSGADQSETTPSETAPPQG